MATGTPDYSSILKFLNNSKLQKSNNALYQTITGLIGSSKSFGDLVSQQFATQGGQTESISNALQGALNSINELNNEINAILDTFTTLALLGQVHVIEAIPGATIQPAQILGITVIKDYQGGAFASNITFNGTIDATVNPKITTNYGILRLYISPTNNNFYSW